MIQVVCWKWETEKETFRYRETYTAEHVNLFAKMIRKHLHCPHEIVCITDDPEGIDPSIRIVPLWDDLKQYGMCYRRLKLFSKEMKDIIGDRFISMDLDCVITDDITDLVQKNDFMIWQPRTTKTPYCGSMWLMDAGARAFVWEEFNEKDLIWLKDRGGWCPGKANRWAHGPAYDAGFIIGSDQAYISYKLYPKEKVWTKEDGVYNFSDLGRELPDNCKIVFFPGKHDPNHTNLYFKYPWIPEHYPKEGVPLQYINCITFLWGPGPYNAEYVNKLFNMIDKHLTYPHKNICFTNMPEGIREGIEIKPLHNEWMKHNLKKAIQFDPDNGLEGRVLSFDLDIVILNSLDMYAEYTDEFCICEAVNQKRKGKCGGNFMAFDSGYGAETIWKPLIENYEYYEKETEGFERFLYDRLIKKMTFWPQHTIVSYKKHVKKGKVRDWDKVRMIWHHGGHKLEDVKDKITLDNWK
jgi:hypothetical protein